MRQIINKIYAHLEDEQSREIFSNRLLYTLTNDYKYIRNIV